MKLYQTESNCNWFTDEPIFSVVSKKQLTLGYEVVTIDKELVGLFSWEELVKYMRYLNKDEYIYIRLINSNALPIKSTRKKERSVLTKSLRYDVMNRDRFCCVLCGITGKDSVLEIDHIIPISLGGKTILNNLQTLCYNCNRGKATK